MIFVSAHLGRWSEATMLCTLEDVKARLEIAASDTSLDVVITDLIEQVSAALARHAGRTLAGRPVLERVTIVQKLSVAEQRQDRLDLAAYPVASISELLEAAYEAWDDAVPLVAGEDYQLDAEAGTVYRIGYWLPGVNTVRVSYTGGYTVCEPWVAATEYAEGDTVSLDGSIYVCSAAVDGLVSPADDEDHWALAAGERPLPIVIRKAAIKQTCYEFQNRNKIGVISGGAAGGSFQRTEGDGLLAGVKEDMEEFRRLRA
jgi:hypothetical protein